LAKQAGGKSARLEAWMKSTTTGIAAFAAAVVFLLAAAHADAASLTAKPKK